MLEKRTITFDPVPHTYTDEIGNPYVSCTQLIQKIEHEFDTKYWAMYRAVDQVPSYKPYPNPEAQTIKLSFNGVRKEFHIDTLYLGVIPLGRPVADIKKEWEDGKDYACDKGNKKHEYFEDCIERFTKTSGIQMHQIPDMQTTFGCRLKIDSLEELENSPLKETHRYIYEKIRSYIEADWTCFVEKRVYHSGFHIAGTIDVLFVKGVHFFILDWKTNKKKLKFRAGYYKKKWEVVDGKRTRKIETKEWVNTGKMLKYPCDTLEACKGSVYTLQLSLYAYLCECWGMTCLGLVLCHIRDKVDDKGDYVFDDDGNHIELEPEFYKIEYRKQDIVNLITWYKNN